jgi:hypothetical protein
MLLQPNTWWSRKHVADSNAEVVGKFDLARHGGRKEGRKEERKKDEICQQRYVGSDK